MKWMPAAGYAGYRCGVNRDGGRWLAGQAFAFAFPVNRTCVTVAAGSLVSAVQERNGAVRTGAAVARRSRQANAPA
jgi:hypothetical protein